MPPATRTLPLGKRVAVNSARAVIMLPVTVHVPTADAADGLAVGLAVAIDEGGGTLGDRAAIGGAARRRGSAARRQRGRADDHPRCRRAQTLPSQGPPSLA